MRKRVLLAEQSDAIRGVAETVLRQNGFEVISVAAAEKALEVLELTRPDLMIIGDDLITASQQPLYERIRNHPKNGATAMLLFSDSEGDLPFPPEAIIPKPFDPEEFLEKVRVFSGQLSPDKERSAPNPLKQASLDDDFLDAALGMDQIDVTDSEEINKTPTSAKNTMPKAADKFIGLENAEMDHEKATDSGKVESVIISDSKEIDIKRPTEKDKQVISPSASGKLEILTDQHMLTDPNAMRVDREGQVHDYEWFVDEMRQEAESTPSFPSPTSERPSDKESSPDLSFAEPASIIDPVTPPPGPSKPESTPSQEAGSGVNKFLDEFKKEVEKYHSEGPESINLEPEPPSDSSLKDGERFWQETVENIATEQAGLFTRQLCTELAEKIAEKIVAKIDSEKLLDLLKNEIILHSRNKSPK